MGPLFAKIGEAVVFVVADKIGEAIGDFINDMRD